MRYLSTKYAGSAWKTRICAHHSMGKLMARGKTLVVAFALIASVDCSRVRSESANPTQPDAATLATSVTATSVPAASAYSASAADLTAKLNAYYAGFVDGTTFDFMRDAWAPHIDHYLQWKDLSIDDLVAKAKTFYAGKRGISIHVQGHALPRADGVQTALDYVVATRWTEAAPNVARACGFLDDSLKWHPSSRIEHKVDVRVRMIVDRTDKVVAYDELGAVMPSLKVSNGGEGLPAYATIPPRPVRNLDADTGGTLVPDGTIVENLGDTFVCALDTAEIDTLRKIRADGHDVWMLSTWRSSTGHSYVGEDVLLPAP